MNIQTAERHPGLRRRSAALLPEHLYKFAGMLFLFALAYRFFDTLSRTFLLAFAAAIVAVGLNAIASRIPLKRKWSAALIGLVLFGALGLGLWFGGSAVFSQAQDLVEQAPQMEAELRSWADQIGSRIGLDVEKVGERVTEAGRGLLSSLSGSGVLGNAMGALELLVIPILILFGALFALGKPNDHLLEPVLRAVPAERRASFRRMLELLGTRLLGWLKGQLISMVTVAILATLAFYLIGVPYALLFGIVNGLAEIVPIFGPWVGGIPAIIVATLDDPMKGLWTAGAILLIQQIESQIVTPLAMANAAEIHPFVTLFSIFLFGGLFGFLGILLALPLVILVWTVVQVLWVERAIGAGEDEIAPVVKD
ncbi:AI-2E family transporter [soil metagenome]